MSFSPSIWSRNNSGNNAQKSLKRDKGARGERVGQADLWGQQQQQSFRLSMISVRRVYCLDVCLDAFNLAVAGIARQSIKKGKEL